MLLMLSQWLQGLSPELGFFRVFQYLTFRAVMAAMTALLQLCTQRDRPHVGCGPWYGVKAWPT